MQVQEVFMVSDEPKVTEDLSLSQYRPTTRQMLRKEFFLVIAIQSSLHFVLLLSVVFLRACVWMLL